MESISRSSSRTKAVRTPITFLATAIHFPRPHQHNQQHKMLGLRRLPISPLRSRVIPQIAKRRYASQPVETSIPAPAAEAQQHRQIIQQQTQNAIAPQSQPAARPPPQDDGLYWTALLLLFVTPPAVWFYYQHRKEHMGKKKEELIQKIKVKREALTKELGK